MEFSHFMFLLDTGFCVYSIKKPLLSIYEIYSILCTNILFYIYSTFTNVHMKARNLLQLINILVFSAFTFISIHNLASPLRSTDNYYDYKIINNMYLLTD